MTAVPSVSGDGPLSEPGAGKSSQLSVGHLWLIFATELMLILCIQLPVVADFSKFAFYDQGAWLRLDALFAGGRTPTVDLGYSYGMLPLLLSRAWFACLGRTPTAYIAFVALCNLVGAWGMAGLVEVSGFVKGEGGTAWGGVAIVCLLLPFAIMPDNYSLMHPMEMALFLVALGQQARGRYGSALALATAAVLTKPSMAYALGLMLVAFATRLRKRPGILLPPILVAAGGITLFSMTVGIKPALANILPLTGGRSYRLMNFGFFRAGRDFWLHDAGEIRRTIGYYVFTPALFWILATLILFAGGIMSLMRVARKNAVRPLDPLIVTLAALHAAFIFVFYAWPGSWTYYSYLPVAGLLIVLSTFRRKAIVLLPLAMVAILAHTDRFSSGLNAWQWWRRSPTTAGLWTFDEYGDEWRVVRQISALVDSASATPTHTLFLTNGALSVFWPELQTPESWFLSPGIPTPLEIDRVRAQMDAANAIVLCKDYDQNQEAWKWPEFDAQRRQFDPKPLWDGRHFKILQRIPAPATTQTSSPSAP